MSESEWKIPSTIAIGLHFLLIAGAIYLPGFFDAKPKFADIYTVSLINVADVAPEPVVEKAPAIKKNAPVVKAKKIAPVAVPVKKIVKSPRKAVSIKPLKRKKRKKVRRKAKTQSRDELARIKRQKLAEALRQEEIAEKRAKKALEELQRERELLKKDSFSPPAAAQSTPAEKTSGNSRISGSMNLLQGQYHAAIFARLHQFWSLPEYMQKKPELTAVVVITINKNGNIVNMFFEKKSGDRIFDQFVTKTIESASPLPPIPPAMKKQRYEIGLRFKPGSIR
ncbi:energy transducer TonB [Desulfomarina sp.]